MTDTTQAALRQQFEDAYVAAYPTSAVLVPALLQREDDGQYAHMQVQTAWTLYCAALAAQAVPAAWATHVQGCIDGWRVSADDQEATGHQEAADTLRGCAADLARIHASPAPAEAKEEPTALALAQAAAERRGGCIDAIRAVLAAAGYKSNGDVTQLPKLVAEALATPQPQAAQPVFIVATGEEYEGEATYTRHEGAPPPLCDYEGPLYTAAPALTEEQEREAFEAWAKTFRDLECDKGLVNLRYLGLHKTYVDYDVHRAWVVWQARAALRSTQGGSDGN